MTQTAVTRPLFSLVARTNPLVRMVGRDEPAWSVLAGAAARFDPAVLQVETPLATAVGNGHAAAGDYAQIDASLAVVTDQDAGQPAVGVGYSGMAPAQRGAFLFWLREPTAPAPRAFQWLYLANLEVRLLEPDPMATLAHQELLRLRATPGWEGQLVTPRLLLAYWLAQDGAGLAQWLASQPTADADLLDVALGLQARLGQPLGVDELPTLFSAWRVEPPNMTNAVLALRLSSLATNLGAELLQYAVPGEQKPLPWRALHRDLHLAIPQPRVRPLLEPLLVDMLAMAAPLPASNGASAEETAPAYNGNAELERAHLIVEFRQSRSEFFDWALRQAKKQAGFQQLMDEDRHIVYRAPFRRNETRKFWSLWDCVQSWSNSRVYCQGRELDKAQVFPGSPQIR